MTMPIKLRLRHLTGIRIENIDLEDLYWYERLHESHLEGCNAEAPLDDNICGSPATTSNQAGTRARTISETSTTSTIKPYPRNRRDTIQDVQGYTLVEESPAQLETETPESVPARRSPTLNHSTPSNARRPPYLPHRSRSRLVIPREAKDSSTNEESPEAPLLAKFRDLAFPPPSQISPKTYKRRSLSISTSHSHLLGPVGVSHHEELHPRRVRASSSVSSLHYQLPFELPTDIPESDRLLEDPSPSATEELNIRTRLARCFVTLSEICESAGPVAYEDLVGDASEFKSAARAESPAASRRRFAIGKSEIPLASRSSSTSDIDDHDRWRQNTSLPMSRASSQSSCPSSTISSRSSSPSSRPASTINRDVSTIAKKALKRHSTGGSSPGKAPQNGGNVPQNGSRLKASPNAKARTPSPLTRSPGSDETATKGKTIRSLGPQTDLPATIAAVERTKECPSVPFYLSPIHPPSTHPSFASLSCRDDFAEWLDDEAKANGTCRIDVWVDTEELAASRDAQRDDKSDGKSDDKSDLSATWVKFEYCSRDVSFDQLVPVVRRTVGEDLHPNRLVLTFQVEGVEQDYCLPVAGEPDPWPLKNELPRTGASTPSRQLTAAEFLAKSRRETRMSKGPSLAQLHKLVEAQVVARRSRQGLDQMLCAMDRTIALGQEHTQMSRLRELHAYKMQQLQQDLSAVTHNLYQRSQMRDGLQEILAARQSILEEARCGMAMPRGVYDTVAIELKSLREEYSALDRSNFARKSYAAQRLDEIFPIQPLDAQTLLYSILRVPLPIPLGKDEAPPLSVSSSKLPQGYKVDEDTNASALGFAALLVYYLNTLLEMQIPYPVTCVGSKSVVRDNISIISGPRT